VDTYDSFINKELNSSTIKIFTKNLKIMVSYDEVGTSKKIKRRALLVTCTFYIILFGLLILGYQESIVDLFPDFIMEWFDTLFNMNTTPAEVAPQADML